RRRAAPRSLRSRRRTPRISNTIKTAASREGGGRGNMATLFETILKKTSSLSVDNRRRLIALVETQSISHEIAQVLQTVLAERKSRRPNLEELLGELWAQEEVSDALADPEHWRAAPSSRRVH